MRLCIFAIFAFVAFQVHAVVGNVAAEELVPDKTLSKQHQALYVRPETLKSTNGSRSSRQRRSRHLDVPLQGKLELFASGSDSPRAGTGSRDIGESNHGHRLGSRTRRGLFGKFFNRLGRLFRKSHSPAPRAPRIPTCEKDALHFIEGNKWRVNFNIDPTLKNILEHLARDGHMEYKLTAKYKTKRGSKQFKSEDSLVVTRAFYEYARRQRIFYPTYPLPTEPIMNVMWPFNWIKSNRQSVQMEIDARREYTPGWSTLCVWKELDYNEYRSPSWLKEN